MTLTLGSHFDGIAGFPLAAAGNGIEVVWATEIEPFPIVVSKAHFPHMKHYGSITDVSGAELEPVDIITFGSPCQDLSVAGKRAGLEGERSGLFMEAVRTIREMREATSGVYPRIAVWENVPGAMSSNNGADFRAVLEEILEAEVPVPRSGKWASAGMVRGNGREIAWRILDAQYGGVPQRRRRIFLICDFRGECAGEILFIEEGLSGDSQESGEARQEVAGDTGDGIAKPIGIDVYNFAESGDIAVTLTANSGSSPTHAGPAVMVSHIDSSPEGISGAVSSKWAKGTGGPAGDECYNLVVEPRSQDGVCRIHHYGVDVMPPLCSDSHGTPHAVAYEVDEQLLFENHSQDTRYVGPLDVAPIVSATFGMGGNNQPFVVNKPSYTVRRLTPLECERLMGFPDGWTDIPGASDTARYKALGNSVAIPCVRWIMRRIKEQLENMGG